MQYQKTIESFAVPLICSFADNFRLCSLRASALRIYQAFEADEYNKRAFAVKEWKRVFLQMKTYPSRFLCSLGGLGQIKSTATNQGPALEENGWYILPRKDSTWMRLKKRYPLRK